MKKSIFLTLLVVLAMVMTASATVQYSEDWSDTNLSNRYDSDPGNVGCGLSNGTNFLHGGGEPSSSCSYALISPNMTFPMNITFSTSVVSGENVANFVGISDYGRTSVGAGVNLYKATDAMQLFCPDSEVIPIAFTEWTSPDYVNLEYKANGTYTIFYNDVLVSSGSCGSSDFSGYNRLFVSSARAGNPLGGVIIYAPDTPPEVCQENWTASYTLCNTSNEQTLTYADQNACGTFEDLPVGNGTVSACNYCTSAYNTTYGECVNNARAINYVYTNSCCADTGLESDCNAPSNTTGPCQGAFVASHSANDIPSVVVDGLVEMGITILSFVTMIVVILGLVWVKKQVRK